MGPAPVVATRTGIRLTVHLQPNARRSELAGLHGDALKVRIAAPPVDGAANAAVIAFLADRLQVPRGSVRLLSGAASRRKRLEIDGVSLENARLALGMETA
jgi:uncharacterized protein (TIGR00251 family)